MVQKRRQVSRILAIGGSAEDQIRRLTKGESFTCCYGSEDEHQILAEFCMEIQSLLAETGQQLSDFSPEELKRLLLEMSAGEADV